MVQSRSARPTNRRSESSAGHRNRPRTSALSKWVGADSADFKTSVGDGAYELLKRSAEIGFTALDTLISYLRASGRPIEPGCGDTPTAKGSRRGKAPEPFALTVGACFPRAEHFSRSQRGPVRAAGRPDGASRPCALGERGERRGGAQGVTRCSDLGRFRLRARPPQSRGLQAIESAA